MPVHEKTLHSVRLGDKSHGSINYIKKQNENRTQWDFVNGHYRSASHVFAAEKRQTFLNISTIWKPETWQTHGRRLSHESKCGSFFRVSHRKLLCNVLTKSSKSPASIAKLTWKAIRAESFLYYRRCVVIDKWHNIVLRLLNIHKKAVNPHNCIV